VLADALDQNLALASGQPSLIISAERPAELSSPPHDEPLTVSPRWVVPVCFTCQEPIRTTMQAIAPIWCWPSRV
jgi:hypothetical protein